MNMDVEYKKDGTYERFSHAMRKKRVALMYDKNTKPFADGVKDCLPSVVFTDIFFDTDDYIPTMEACAHAEGIARGCDFLLAVGSGSLNDTAKYVATKIGIESGVFPTAASMDGYVSRGSALMDGGRKVTLPVNTPTHVLIDPEVIAGAPKDMTASGFGDILGKYTCMTDWKLSHIVRGEEIHEEAFAMMEKARGDCVSLYGDLTQYKPDAIGKLIDALIAAGVSMAKCGNSRPASGSEHHMSHFLEMDFVRRGERVPLHGVKVAIGTLISIDLYGFIAKCDLDLPYKKEIGELASTLPKVEDVKAMLQGMGCPTKFSDIGVRRETMEDMLERAYTVRDRYTILTYYHENDLMKYVKDDIMRKYF